jgi:hypothetical protein
MGTRSRGKQHHGVAHVDQEKSLVDIFEHVIRGVRIDRLRELLRESEKHNKRPADRKAWGHRPLPTTA